MDKLFFAIGETGSKNFFLFVLGVVKSISANGKNCTLLNDGGSHVQGSDVEECCCFTRVLASAAKRTAAMWEQASWEQASPLLHSYTMWEQASPNSHLLHNIRHHMLLSI